MLSAVCDVFPCIHASWLHVKVMDQTMAFTRTGRGGGGGVLLSISMHSESLRILSHKVIV